MQKSMVMPRFLVMFILITFLVFMKMHVFLVVNLLPEKLIFLAMRRFLDIFVFLPMHKFTKMHRFLVLHLLVEKLKFMTVH